MSSLIFACIMSTLGLILRLPHLHAVGIHMYHKPFRLFSSESCTLSGTAEISLLQYPYVKCFFTKGVNVGFAYRSPIKEVS